MNTARWCPFTLEVDHLAALLNAEFADHPVYDSFELQWFDDDLHGRGMLAFLARRGDRRVDYYVDPGLSLDRAGYDIGGGTGVWEPTTFSSARLAIDADGVDAEVGFVDVDGRGIEIRVDDRAAGRRRTSDLLAPVGAGITHPSVLLLVHLHGFDLVRRVGPEPVIRIDGRDVAIGTLPGAVLHRRHLIKAAAPVSVAMLCPAASGPMLPIDPAVPGSVRLGPGGQRIAALNVEHGGASAQLQLAPAFPDITELPDGRGSSGTWQVIVDAATITGGTWWVGRDGGHVDLGIDVTEPWQPEPGLPALMRTVTRWLPTFRRWPTTYRWRARIVLDDPPCITSWWERSGSDLGAGHRRLTRS